MRELTEADYLALAAMGAAGARLEDAGCRLRMSRRALGRILQTDERAAMAWAAGRSEPHQKLVSKLIEKALGGEVVPLLFSLKSVFGYREGEPLDAEQRGGPLVNISLPASLSPEQYTRMIDVKPRAVPAGGERDADG